MKKLIALALPLAIFAIADVAHAQSEPTQGTAQRAARRSRDRIEHDEITNSRADNAYDLIQGTRSIWLNRHRPSIGGGGTTGTAVNDEGGRNQAEGNKDDLIVMVDGNLYGDRESLKQISIAQVWSVEFVSPAQARLKFNRQTRDGAIVIYTSADNDAGARPTS